MTGPARRTAGSFLLAHQLVPRPRRALAIAIAVHCAATPVAVAQLLPGARRFAWALLSHTLVHFSALRYTLFVWGVVDKMAQGELKSG